MWARTKDGPLPSDHPLTVAHGWVFAFSSAALMVACASTPAAENQSTVDAATVDVPDSSASSPNWCSALGQKMDRCDKMRECDSKFSAWCPLQSKTNSRAFELADTQCLALSCEADARNDCRYRRYEESMLTQSQRQLLDAACATCGDGAACKNSILHYDSSKGPKAVSDMYVAVWELSDSIVDALRAKCTGTVPDGGDCAKAFGQCSVDLYLAALPECPP